MKHKVYQWSLAARIQHWIRAVSIFVLIITGFYIHYPFSSGIELPHMGTMRMVHFIFAYILVIGLFIRIYFAFRKDIIGDWRDFNPIKNLKNVPDMAGYYLFSKGSHKEYSRYNPIQALVYLILAFVILIQAVTGFAIYSGAPTLQNAFGWVNILFGGVIYTRVVHYAMTWVFIVFIHLSSVSSIDM